MMNTAKPAVYVVLAWAFVFLLATCAKAENWVRYKTEDYSVQGGQLTCEIWGDNDTPGRWDVRITRVTPPPTTSGGAHSHTLRGRPRQGTNGSMYFTVGLSSNGSEGVGTTVSQIKTGISNGTVLNVECDVIHSGGSYPADLQVIASHTVGDPPEADTDCKASVNITNPYGVPTWFKVMHSIDGELGRVLLQPGETWAQEWEVTCGGEFYLAYQPTGEKTGDDVWFLPEDPLDPGAPSEDPGDWNNGDAVPVGPPEDPAPETPPPPTPTDANLPTKSNQPTQPWTPTPDPVDTDDLLDRTTYRQGVDKLVKSTRETTEAVNELKDALTGDPGVTPGEPDVDTVELAEVNTGLFPATVPNFFTGAVPTESVIAFTSPAITIMGKTMPARTLTLDLADYATPVGWFRAFLSTVLWILFFILITRTTLGISK